MKSNYILGDSKCYHFPVLARNPQDSYFGINLFLAVLVNSGGKAVVSYPQSFINKLNRPTGLYSRIY